MSEQNPDSKGSAKERIRWLWREGVARRVVVEKDGRRPVDLPLVAFLVAAVLAPWLVALGGVVGIVLGYQFRVDRSDAPSAHGAPVDEPPAPATGTDDTPGSA